MCFNHDKCQVLSIIEKKQKFSFDYQLNGPTLEHVTSAWVAPAMIDLTGGNLSVIYATRPTKP